MAQRQWRSDDTATWNYGFGSGSDGTSYAVPANAGCSGTASATALTIDAASTFADGDLVMIHQTRGTGVGLWELNKVASGGGTTTLTLAHALINTYTDSGASQAQIIELKEYENLALTGTTTVSAWDGNKGGIIAFLDKGTTSGSSATLALNGSTGATANGTTLTSAVTTGGGFRGGYGRQTGSSGSGRQGEGTAADGGESSAANGNGGGAAYGTGGAGSASGGGGGNGAAGSVGNSDEQTDGNGGGAVGVASLVTANFGGGGGGCFSRDGVTQTVASGGSGGGIAFVFSKTLDLTGITINANGGAGGDGSRKGDGGSGAGGSILIKCTSATLGTNKATAAAGSTVGLGGAAGAGRIHIDYSGSYTGTTSPTIDVTNDLTIIEAASGAFFQMF